MTRYRCSREIHNHMEWQEMTHREAIQYLVDNYVEYYEDSTDDEVKRLVLDREDANRIYKTQDVKKLKKFLENDGWFDKVEILK